MSTRIKSSFAAAVSRVTEALAKEGFGILTDIDIAATMNEKLGVAFRNYRILGACNPPFAHRALEAEDKIGTMLPCNVIVQEIESGQVEIAAVDPLRSMESVENKDLRPIATEIRERLVRVVNALA